MKSVIHIYLPDIRITSILYINEKNNNLHTQDTTAYALSVFNYQHTIHKQNLLNKYTKITTFLVILELT
jgi:hypothetical protein